MSESDARTCTVARVRRAVLASDGERYDVVLSVDLERLLDRLAYRAASGKTKRASALKGAIVAKARRAGL
jgi:hypothetical protein